ncbi:TetR/AcrR family transcriptional regulator [Psychrobacillus sp. INOP01]|uniref:TetR/AcrR family transcriptional regulator n=1 Tax=Psychrobacillus sp. INOP01 TaxID=2829187 RepID=UPI001BADBFDD|nr:TetR/AcrR family transcriptional regulator [Psychrobacillus sp. INOP01]QUG41878.1 TetR/AcrR family transcriptional regulator [Psychrobacillus sp. INOP01]
MAILTEEKIFSVTEEIIMRKGVQKTTLSDIAKELGVTHAAFYKHYKNKEDLLQQLALKWLETTSKELLEWKAPNGVSSAVALHNWLWLLATTKKKLYHDDKHMFRLYTDYLERTQILVKDHLKQLAKKAESISGLKKSGHAIITAFVYFHNPYFADRWDNEFYKETFEDVWKLIANKLP